MSLLIFSCIAFFAGYIATWLFEIILRSNKKLYERYYVHHELLFGYHVHHSTYGLISFVASVLFFLNGKEFSALFAVWFGLGIIVKHTVLDHRIVFIEKQRSIR